MESFRIIKIIYPFIPVEARYIQAGKLGEMIKQHFSSMYITGISMQLTMKPLVSNLNDLPEEILEEFLELTHDSSEKKERKKKERLKMRSIKCIAFYFNYLNWSFTAKYQTTRFLWSWN